MYAISLPLTESNKNQIKKYIYKQTPSSDSLLQG